MKETESICTKCARGCNITIGAREGVVHRQTPRDNNSVNSSWMCDQGRLDFHYLTSESRLTQPLIKENGQHRVAAWGEAIKKAADGLRGLRADQIAIVASARMTNEELYLVRSLALKLGTHQVDVVPRFGDADKYLVHADKNPNSNGVALILSDAPGQELAAIRDAVQKGSVKALICLQENLLKEAGFLPSDLSRLVHLVSGHILANPTAEASHVVLPLSASAEKRGSMVNATGRLQRLNAAISPPGEAREDWEVLRDLVLALGDSRSLYTLEDIFKALAADVEQFNGLSLGKIGSEGVDIIRTNQKIPLLEKEAERKAKGIIVG